MVKMVNRHLNPVNRHAFATLEHKDHTDKQFQAWLVVTVFKRIMHT